MTAFGNLEPTVGVKPPDTVFEHEWVIPLPASSATHRCKKCDLIYSAWSPGMGCVR